MRWKLQAGLGLAAFAIAVIAAMENEGFAGLAVALAGASFWTSAVRIYLAEKG